MIYPLITLCLSIGYIMDGAIAQPTELKSHQVEVHSVVVDMPKVIMLPPPSGEIWDMLELSGQLAVPLPGTQQAAQPRDRVQAG